MVFADPATTIRPLALADEPFCRLLFHDMRGPRFAPLGLADHLLATMLDQQYRAQRLGYAQSFPQAEHVIIEYSGVAVGQLIVTLVAAPPGDCHDSVPVRPQDGSQAAAGALHLVDIAIVSAQRGRGIGTDVIESLTRAARAIGARCITLSVEQSNAAARRLYQRLGFVDTAANEAHGRRMSKPV